MANMVEDVTSKTEKLDVDEAKSTDGQVENEANKMKNELVVDEQNNKSLDEAEAIPKEEEKVAQEIEPKSGVSFPVKLADGMQLNALGIRKKTLLGLGIKIYSFGLYGNNEKLKELLKSKFQTAPAKPTKELFQVVIDSDVELMLRMVIVYGSLTMSMVKKNVDEGIGASIKKLNGGKKDDELTNRVMGPISDSIKLSAGSVIEVTKYPGYTLETKVKGEVVSKAESELLCRAYFHMYLGDDPFDKEAREKFGMSLLSLF
ncbi:Fatty-acid-binding protein [Thalictrum thalictroides]|uniref:Fatty-acid-binding protein n=1 Tax=Thalictrum thalictroides TaxID=46969 RepID=A0A7J6V0T0_THATH|nr:Fatty-acid-binding protein [Thalictrum thalictroides]